MERTYIGDGVYVEFNGYDFKLYTQREEGEHYIHLEASAIKELNNFIDNIMENKKE